MSRRAIKRYEEVLEAEQQNKSEPDDASDDGEQAESNHSTPRPTGSQGLFALLGDNEDEAETGSEQEEALQKDPDYGVDKMPADMLVVDSEMSSKASARELATHAEEEYDRENNTQNAQPSNKKKKKKRRGKKRQDNHTVDRETDPDWIALNEATANAIVATESSVPGWIPSSYFASDDNEDVKAEAMKIMAAIEAIVLPENGQNEDSPDLLVVNSWSKVLHVEPRLLNADSELKRLFGSRVIESERRMDETTGASAARRRGRAGGRNHLRRKVSLVSPRENWFAEAPGLVMELDEEATNNFASGVRYYRYVHEASYARIQDDYRSLVGTHDPNMLVGLYSRYPYHVDTLLQLAELYRQMGELDRAADQIERSLYVLESSWNIAFKPYDGNCRLRFDVLENRSLYVALFRYSQLLTRRGLHRTALEMSKLLLNLDPENDPMGILMVADSFALLCGEYQWIQDMHSDYHLIPVRYFPNFAASSAVACESMILGISGISNRGGSGKGKKMSRKESNESALRRGGTKKADDLLVDALLTFPMLLKPLLSAIQDESGVWTEHRLFDEAWYAVGYEDHGVLLRMCRVYAERSKLLWNSTANKQMLVRCAKAAGELDTAAGTGRDPETGRFTSAFVSDMAKHGRVAKCRALRAEAGEWLRSSGLYQGVQISDFADSTTNLPAEILAGDGADQAVGAVAPREVTLTQSAMEFLQSLLPWREASDAQ